MRVKTWTTFAVGLVLTISVACNGGDGTGTPEPTPTVTPTATSTATQTAIPTETPAVDLEAEVSAAYMAYWEAYREALLTLDPSVMNGFASGDEWERIETEIAALESDGVAARLVVEHDFGIVNLTESEAVILDEFLDRSFYVDPTTLEPQTADVEGARVRDTFHLERQEDNSWLVIRSLRERSP